MVPPLFRQQEGTSNLQILAEHLRKYIDSLEPDVCAIHVSQDGQLRSTSNDPSEDETFCTYFPALELVPQPANVKTIHRADLVEVDRLGPNVDLMCCNNKGTGLHKEGTELVVFKYYFLQQFVFYRWDELQIWMRLPLHPNIAPFDRLVVDKLDGRDVVVGFTSRFIPGGTLEADSTRVFKLEWLRQLLHVIDDLNLKYGLQHQDVAARNLLVDPETDRLMIFDFNWTARIGYPYRTETYASYWDQRNDVKGAIFTLYEIITRDTHFRQVSWQHQNPEDVQSMKEYV